MSSSLKVSDDPGEKNYHSRRACTGRDLYNMNGMPSSAQRMPSGSLAEFNSEGVLTEALECRLPPASSPPPPPPPCGKFKPQVVIVTNQRKCVGTNELWH